MEGSNIDWSATAGIIVVVVSIYGSFFVAGHMKKAGRRALAITAPFWVFAPTALLFEWWRVGRISPVSALVLIGYAAALSLLMWGHMQGQA
jgi:hypothetical protein